VLLQLVTILLLILMPSLVTWLPNLMDELHGF
jgi:hypothetical protein